MPQTLLDELTALCRYPSCFGRVVGAPGKRGKEGKKKEKRGGRGEKVGNE